MGNSPSNSDDEDDEEHKKMDGNSSDGDDADDNNSLNLTDLSGLFNHTSLRTLAANIKEEVPENVLQQYRFQILRWLEDRENKLEETLTISQFCDWLQNKGVSREEAARTFQQFDTDGSGVVEVNTMLTIVKSMNGQNVMGELGRSIRMLQACSLTPGFVDVYAKDHDAVQQHAEKILKYLIRNRSPSLSLPFPYLNGFNNTASMRNLVLKSTFQQMKDKGYGHGQGSLESGEEVRTINPCYSNIEVSSNTSDAYRLTNGDPNTFWQSDGSARSHWIRLHIKNNVVIKNLSATVASSDSSYMPEMISVSAGKNFRTLRSIKEVTIPSYVTGDVTLLQNMKHYYPIIQINIKRCRNDGCDTRIHGIKTVGYKVIRELGISVADASAMWYLQVLATTVTMTIPLAPHLRTGILDHTKKALGHIPPLSLCPVSSDRPKFLTKHVLQEVEKFVTDIALYDGEILTEGLQVLLSFNLARGNVGALLRTVKLLQENPETSLPCADLLRQMQQARDACWEKSGHQLTFTLSGSDGGQSDENTGPENVLNHSWTMPVQSSYLTSDGNTKVNMVFKSPETIQLSKLRIRVASGGKGAQRGMVFVFKDDRSKFEMAKMTERFKSYDTWGRQEYDYSVQVRNTGLAGKNDDPVAFFSFDDDCDEVDVPVSWHPTGEFVLVKFVDTRQEATKMGIVGIKFYGFNRKLNLTGEELKTYLPLEDKKSDCSSIEIIQTTLQFLIDLSQDQASKMRHGIAGGKPEYLEFSDTPLEVIWSLYRSFNDTEKWQSCALLTLKLLHCLLPVFTSLTEERKNSSAEFFQHICKIIDSPQNKEQPSILYELCRHLIIDGAAVFFPDKEARREQLFSMMRNVESLSKAQSVMLVFQSLCQFFSSVDPSGLLDLPKPNAQNYDITKVLRIMETMISVSSHEFTATLKTGKSQVQVEPLLQLVSALQTSLLGWCWAQIVPEDDGKKEVNNSWREKALQMISKYSVFVAKKASEACKLLQSCDSVLSSVELLENSFLGSTVRQLVLILNFLCDSCCSETRIQLIRSFQSLCEDLQHLSEKIPKLFPPISSDHWASVQTEDIVLRTWEVESSHNYENNQHQTQVFTCPGANKFVVDFDPRCETERRYDYLAFNDAKGVQMRFDQKVGTTKWPKQVNFSGPHLHFLFHSDSSNTEWGYKFKVTARGSPDIPLSWPFDLQLSLTKLMGRLCGATLKANPFAVTDHLLGGVSSEQDVLRSELWTTLFRGGYMIGRLERSLSGKLATADSSVLEFLWNFLNKGDGLPTKLIEKCKEQQKGVQIERGDTDEAVLAVFAALVWHTQQLREDIQKLVLNPGEVTPSEGLLLAYSTAHSLKTQLLSQKQKLATEKAENEEVQDPAVACRDKALFLLKFGGLTKVQLRNEIRSKASKQWKKVLHRRDKQGRFDALEKYPSFRLVIDFVQDPAWITERVNSMLQQRSQHARAVAEVYSFCVQFLQIHHQPDIFQIPNVLFFQELLWYQDGFCKHYADSLDGCGLQQESVVRESFYALIRKLADPYHKNRRIQMEKCAVPAYEYIQACLLHLIDVEWQPYDLSFVEEVNLPALYLGIAKETVKMRECTFGQEEEVEELVEYNRCMKWFNECSEGFDKWYENAKKDESDKEEKKAVQMFVARFCDLLEVEITCDGCNVTLPGRRFRCLQCVDMDLCATCYAGGVKPEGEHTDDHDIVHLVYKCNKCQAFIVGTRIHCNVCEDFDLCYGCHEKGSFPPEHDSSHDISKFPLVKLRTSQDSDSLIQGYIHQHVWLLFTILSMSAGEIMMSSHVDLDYVKLAAQLQSQCMQIITHCLKQVPDDAEDSGKVLQQSDKSLQAIESRQIEAFAIHTQERIMGLLGAMIPRDNVVMSSGNFNFTTQDFIQLLFRIARGESGHEVNTRHLAMGLLGPLLNRCDTAVADQAVVLKEEGSDKIAGQHCINYLFTFGADCLQKCGLEWACSVSRILQSLYSSSEWKAVIHHHLNDCVQMLTSKPDLPSIFALFVMAGFPEVLTIGTLVNFTQYAGLERKTGVVLKHFPDKNQTLVIEIKTRKRHTIMDKYVDCVTSNEQIWDSTYISVFYRTTKTIIESIKEDSEVTVETAWVLSLCLKVLSNSLKNSYQPVIPELYQSSFIQCLVFIASKGTEFSQQWFLKDLEVLSLMLYTNQGGLSTPGIKTENLTLSERLAAALEKRSQSRSATYNGLLDDESDDIFMSSSSSSDTSSDSDDEDSDDVTVTSGAMANKGENDINKVFEDIDEKTRVMFETLHTDLKLPLDVLKAIYEMNDKSPDDVVKAIVENLETSPATAKDDLKRLSEKWESIAHAKSPEAAIETAASDKVIDTGIHYHPALNQINRVLEKATAEDHMESQKLIPTPDNDSESDMQKKERSKSSELLKQELEKHGRTCCRDYILKVNLAMSVLYARQVLASLLAQWPNQGPVITAELLGCKDPQQIPCILDLLNKTECKSRFQNVVEKVMLYCEPNSLVPIAKTAGQFMEEVTLSSILKESDHHYKESSACKDSVQLPGASCLRISFDGRCSLKEGDTLVYSTSSNMQQNVHEFTGSAGANWTSFQIPGDVVYFEFTVNSGGGNTSWGYKFTVTAGTRDSFQTGYVILSNVLSTDLALNLHISELWLILVYVVTKQTGEQRLKGIQLLLKILETQNRCPSGGKLKLDLGCLKPLWQLYDSSTKDQVDSGSVVPPVIRALTELFLQVEATAMNWGMTQEYLLAIQDVDELKLAVRQGIMNVAAVSTMIGYNNAATELIALVKKKKMTEK